MKNLRQRIQALLKSPDYRPLNKSEFARTLNLKPNERSDLRAELARLEKKGDIVYGKKGRFTPRAKSQGKGGKGKRIDMEMESATYKFKINIRDTQGKDGYPTRMMCDFSYK